MSNFITKSNFHMTDHETMKLEGAAIMPHTLNTFKIAHTE